MIYMYNENESAQWKIYKKNDRFLRLELIDDPSFGMNIHANDLTEDSFKKEVLESTDDVYNANVLLDEKTIIRFDNRSLRPSIRKSSNDTNMDIYVVSYDISAGQRVINAQTKHGAYIYACKYDYDNKQLHIIFTLNEKETNPSLEIIFMDNTGSNVIMRHFMVQTRYNKVCMISKSMKTNSKLKRGDRGFVDPTDRVNGKTTYPFRIYVPLRPTKMILFDHDSDKESVEKILSETFHFDPKRSLLISMESTENVREELRKYVYEGSYSCATIYLPDTDHTELKKDKKKKEEILKSHHEKFFETVLGLCSDGWIIRLK